MLSAKKKTAAKSSEKQQNLPRQPILHSPLRSGTQSWFYPAGTTIGLSPNGKQEVFLKGPSGISHSYGRQGEAGPILSADSPYKASKGDLELKLLLQLQDLKTRADEDFRRYRQDGEVDWRHYEAARKKIDICIRLLRHLMRKDAGKTDILGELNRLIDQKKIYNPFALSRLYPQAGTYNFALAKDESFYTAQIRHEQLNAVKSSAENLFEKKEAEVEPRVSVQAEDNRKRTASIALSFSFLPRTLMTAKRPEVKMQDKENSPNWQVVKKVKKDEEGGKEKNAGEHLSHLGFS